MPLRRLPATKNIVSVVDPFHSKVRRSQWCFEGNVTLGLPGSRVVSQAESSTSGASKPCSVDVDSFHSPMSETDCARAAAGGYAIITVAASGSSGPTTHATRIRTRFRRMRTRG
jgi:hypothetical protein